MSFFLCIRYKNKKKKVNKERTCLSRLTLMLFDLRTFIRFMTDYSLPLFFHPPKLPMLLYRLDVAYSELVRIHFTTRCKRNYSVVFLCVMSGASAIKYQKKYMVP